MTRNIPEHAIFFINGKRKMKLKLQLNFIKNTIRKITELLFGMCKNSIFRSQAYTRKGSLEVTFFRTYVYPYVFVCPRILRNSIFCKIELWDTSSVHKWGPSLLEVNRKWTGSEPEVESEGVCTLRFFYYTLSKTVWSPIWLLTCQPSFFFLVCNEKIEYVWT